MFMKPSTETLVPTRRFQYRSSWLVLHRFLTTPPFLGLGGVGVENVLVIIIIIIDLLHLNVHEAFYRNASTHQKISVSEFVTRCAQVSDYFHFSGDGGRVWECSSHHNHHRLDATGIILSNFCYSFFSLGVVMGGGGLNLLHLPCT